MLLRRGTVRPTMLLVTRVEKEKTALSSTMDLHIIHTQILETSAEAVRTEIDTMYDLISSRTDVEGCQVVFLHLGVNYRGKKFHLEKCAYNDATFRVPDERGYQPQGVCILESGELKSNSDSGNSTKKKTVHKFGKCFKTDLDLNTICSSLEDFNSQPVCVSNDPGRFVCNYTYCLSLDRSLHCMKNSKLNDESNGVGKQQAGYHSLFVHVPPFAVIDEDHQFLFILEIMKMIQQQLSQGQDDLSDTN